MQALTFEVCPVAEVLNATNLSGRGSLVEQVYVELRKAIINLSLPPGVALVEQEVAAVLEVSKTPVREAIIRLVREGLVNVIPKSGSYVTSVNIDRYLEACFVRTQLETGCVRRLAAQGVRPVDQIALRANIKKQKDALASNDDAGFFELDEALHRMFFELAGLAGVWQVINFAKAELDRVRHLKRLFGNRQRALVIEEHVALIEAIIGGDPEAAVQALLTNIGAVEDEIASMAENPHILQSIEDLNKLVAAENRTRGYKRKVQG